MKLLKVDSLDQAREKLLREITWDFGKKERIPLTEARGRILGEDILAKEPLPGFVRSTVDGYAVKASDTQGASESLPVFLRILGDVEMGQEAKHVIQSGTCAYVPTGGMLPPGADAMAMVEYCELFGEEDAAVYQSVSPGKNVVQIGEDVQAGETILEAGTLLQAAQIGALAGNGISSVLVYAPLRITILSTGDELRSLEEVPGPGQIFDINTYSLTAMAQELGFLPIASRVLPDREEELRTAIKEAMAQSDLVAISGGSSQGKKDMTARLFSELSSPGVLTHGLAIKPGKPTIAAVDKASETVLLGLPGHPGAALTVFSLLGGWLERVRTGQKERPGIPALMESNVPAAPGKETYLMVKLIEAQEGFLARPVLGKSGLMRTLTGSEGYVKIPLDSEGLKKGDPVIVKLF
ncbi:MAG: molybdopterin molybdotransferase MoeA [Eubacteriales bacterium]|nr:molybdopterin molybdotransferase MoeA [Eubacteriales bacterium]